MGLGFRVSGGKVGERDYNGFIGFAKSTSARSLRMSRSKAGLESTLPMHQRGLLFDIATTVPSGVEV